jgi:acyl-CoA reductase-like NAD-dependent aldehyde dehydrogenase
LIPTIESMTTTSSSDKLHLLVDGKGTPGISRMEVVNAATGENLTNCPRADRNQLEEVVQAAKRAFLSWPMTPLTKRRDALLSLRMRCQLGRSISQGL